MRPIFLTTKQLNKKPNLIRTYKCSSNCEYITKMKGKLGHAQIQLIVVDKNTSKNEQGYKNQIKTF